MLMTYRFIMNTILLLLVLLGCLAPCCRDPNVIVRFIITVCKVQALRPLGHIHLIEQLHRKGGLY